MDAMIEWDRYNWDEFLRGYYEAQKASECGVNVKTHYSQGDTPFDHGWNRWIDKQEKMTVNQ